MKCARHADGPSFLGADLGYFERTEDVNNRLIGIATRITTPRDEVWLSTLHDGDAVVGAAVQTPPFGLSITRLSDEAVEALCEALDAAGWSLPGVAGPAEDAERFAARWSARRGCRAEVFMRQRAYALRSVRPPAGVRGAMRVADLSDEALVRAWAAAFAVDTGLPAYEHPVMQSMLASLLRAGSVSLWDDGGAVSMVARSANTLRGARIGTVYTPPEHRGKGYASACTAAVSQRVLDEGRSACFLFTDLANPTSNKIYTALGYEPVCDFAMMHFVP